MMKNLRELYIGYVYTLSGEVQVFPMEKEQIANFIMKYSWEPKVIVTDGYDRPFLDVRVGLIFKCADKKYFTRLQQELYPMQMGEKEACEFIPYQLNDNVSELGSDYYGCI